MHHVHGSSQSDEHILLRTSLFDKSPFILIISRLLCRRRLPQTGAGDLLGLTGFGAARRLARANRDVTGGAVMRVIKRPGLINGSSTCGIKQPA